MFLMQDYPAKELLILNDCPQQVLESCDLRIRVFNRQTRTPSLGEKRNFLIEQAHGELIAVWDDDDIYLPWRLSVSVEQMRTQNVPFYCPDKCWTYPAEDVLLDASCSNERNGHPMWIFAKSQWRELGGYPSITIGEDMGFLSRFHQSAGKCRTDEFEYCQLSRRDRFLITREKSRYLHTGSPGTQPQSAPEHGRFQLLPRPIADDSLRRFYDQLIDARQIALCGQIASRGSVANGGFDSSVVLPVTEKDRHSRSEDNIAIFPRPAAAPPDNNVQGIQVATGMITAPRPDIVIRDSVDRLRRGGFAEELHLFCEPGVGDIGDLVNVTVHRNDVRLGVIGNWTNCLAWLLEHTTAEYFLICEDDVEFSRGARAALMRGIDENRRAGFFSLYTPVRDQGLVSHRRGWVASNRGRDTWGTQAFCLPRSSAQMILAYSPLYAEDQFTGPTDAVIAQCFLDANLPCFYHNPSLADHLGKVSTIGHLWYTEHVGLDFDRNYAPDIEDSEQTYLNHPRDSGIRIQADPLFFVIDNKVSAGEFSGGRQGHPDTGQPTALCHRSLDGWQVIGEHAPSVATITLSQPAELFGFLNASTRVNPCDLNPSNSVEFWATGNYVDTLWRPGEVTEIMTLPAGTHVLQTVYHGSKPRGRHPVWALRPASFSAVQSTTAVIAIGCYKADELPDRFNLFARSARKHGIWLTVRGVGQNYVNHIESKINRLRTWIDELPAAVSRVIYVDAKDSIFSGGLTRIEQKFAALNSPIVTSAEAGCYPVRSQGWSSQFPALHRGRNWTCAGAFMGERRELISALDSLQELRERLIRGEGNLEIVREWWTENLDDQWYWQAARVLGLFPFELDPTFSIFASICCEYCYQLTDNPVFDLQPGRLIDKSSGETPGILHFTGCYERWMAQWAGYLDVI